MGQQARVQEMAAKAGGSRPADTVGISSSPLPNPPLIALVTTTAMIDEDVLTTVGTTTDESGARWPRANDV